MLPPYWSEKRNKIPLSTFFISPNHFSFIIDFSRDAPDRSGRAARKNKDEAWSSCSQLIKSSARSLTVSRLQIFRLKLIHLSEKFSNYWMEASSWQHAKCCESDKERKKFIYWSSLLNMNTSESLSKNWMDLSYKISYRLKSYLWWCSVSLSLFDSWICRVVVNKKKVKKKMTWWCEWKFDIYFFPWFGLVLEFVHCIHRQLFQQHQQMLKRKEGRIWVNRKFFWLHFLALI